MEINVWTARHGKNSLKLNICKKKMNAVIFNWH